jgi:hypothetical protein
VQPELELRDDAEVATAASDGPEQVRILLCRHAAYLTVCSHDLCRHQVVDTQTGLPRQPTHAPTERETGHTRVTDQPTRHGQAVLLCRGVHVLPQRASADPRPLLGWIDRHRIQQTQVDHQAIVDSRRARHAVGTAADSDLHAVTFGELDSYPDVDRTSTLGDDGWAPIDAGVPHQSRLFVPGVRRLDHRAAHRPAQIGNVLTRGQCHGHPQDRPPTPNGGR